MHCSTSPPPSGSHRSPGGLRERLRARALWLAVPLVMLWGAGTAYAFWHFQLRDLRPFAVDPGGLPIAFDATGLRHAAGAHVRAEARATLFHLWDPDCPCNRFNAPHVRELVAAYRARGVRVVALVPQREQPAALAARAERLFGAGVEVARADAAFATVPASPAALVADGDGALAYFGPYSVGAVCSAGSDRFVERALELTLAGQRLGPASLSGVGCYCPWPKT